MVASHVEEALLLPTGSSLLHIACKYGNHGFLSKLPSNNDKHRVIKQRISLFGTMITMVTMVDGNSDKKHGYHGTFL